MPLQIHRTASAHSVHASTSSMRFAHAQKFMHKGKIITIGARCKFHSAIKLRAIRFSALDSASVLPEDTAMLARMRVD